jgi:membrane-associated phospholipid phosphatase
MNNDPGPDANPEVSSSPSEPFQPGSTASMTPVRLARVGTVSLRLYRGLLSPADKVVVCYLTIVAALITIFSFRIPKWWVLVAVHGLGVGLVVALARQPGAAMEPEPSSRKHDSSRPRVFARRRAAMILRFWYPVLMIPLSYKELGYLVPRLHPHDFDHELASIDYRLFGTDPVVWLSRFSSPPLTLLLQLSYLTYYVFPVVLALVLWRRRQFGRMHVLLFFIAVGIYASYIGYIAVPAIGPRFFLANQVAPFRGPLVGNIRRVLDSAEGLTRDCFPSGHTELTILVLYCAWRFERRLFWVILAPATALIFSTVYLRYHYVIDVLAGATLALFLICIGDGLYKTLGGSIPTPHTDPEAAQ